MDQGELKYRKAPKLFNKILLSKGVSLGDVLSDVKYELRLKYQKTVKGFVKRVQEAYRKTKGRSSKF